MQHFAFSMSVCLLFLKNLKSAVSGLSALSRANHLNFFFFFSKGQLICSNAHLPPKTIFKWFKCHQDKWRIQLLTKCFNSTQRPLNAMATSVSSWKESRERERPGYKKKSQTGEKETGEKQVYFREVAIMLLGGGVGAINLRLDNGSSKTNFSCLEDSPTKSSVPGWYIALSKATARVLPCTVIFGS